MVLVIQNRLAGELLDLTDGVDHANGDIIEGRFDGCRRFAAHHQPILPTLFVD